MSVHLALYSRLLFVSVLVCAAVISFFMCSASPIITRVDNGVRRSILRSYNQNPLLFTALMSTETGLQTGTNSETKTSGKFREALSNIDHQSNPLQFHYDQNSPNKQSGTIINQVQRGHSAGGMKPESSIFTSHSLYRGQSSERQQSRVNYHPLSQTSAQNSYNSYSYNYPPIIRKSPQKEAGGSFHQSFSQIWPPENPQNPYNETKGPRIYSPKATGDKTVWKTSPFSSLLSSHSGRYWSTLRPTSRRHYSGYKETNELAAVGVQSTSSGIQSSKFLGFASQTAPHVPSLSKSWDTSVIKSNPSPENVTSFITDVSQRMNSASGGETQRYKKAQSYLFKNSQTSFYGHETIKRVTGDEATTFSTTPHEPEASVEQAYSGLSSNLIQFQQSHRKDPTQEDQHFPNNVSPLSHDTKVVQDGVQTHSLTKHHPVSTVYSTQHSLHPASNKTLESFADSQYSYTTSSEKPAVGRSVNTAARDFMHGYKPGRSMEILHGFTGLENPTWRAVKEPFVLSSNDGNNSQQYSFNKGKYYKFKIANLHSSLSPKYSFGQKGASTTTPAKLEMTPTVYSSPSPGILHITQTTTVSTAGSFTSGLKEVWSESNAGTDRNQNHRQFGIYERIYGLKGFYSRPLEGADALVREPDKSATLQQGFEGFELRSSQIWQPKSSRVQRGYNQPGETEQDTSNLSTQSQNKLQDEDLKPLLKPAESIESVKHSRFSPDKYKRNHKTYAFLGFQLVQNRTGNNKTHWKHTKQNPTTASPTHKVSSAYLTSAGSLKVESSLKYEPRMAIKRKPVAMKARLLNSSTSSIVRGRRVKGKGRKKLNESTSLSNNSVSVPIVRLAKFPISVRAVTYTDILGSASFSGVRATTQAPTTVADKDYFPNTTATTRQKEWRQESRENTSRSPEANAEDDTEDFSSVEEKKQSVKSGEVDSGMETFDALLDKEGSGSGGFNLPDVLLTDNTESQELSEDLLELDYLQKSTGNLSFRSMKLSHSA